MNQTGRSRQASGYEEHNQGMQRRRNNKPANAGMPSGGQAQKGAELGMAVQLVHVQYPLGRDAKHPPDPA
jgi:hypothetical protein